MAESDHLLGYQCEFIDSVHDKFYCKKCTLVARGLTYTSCCVESYCHACIADTQQQDKPCPECGHQNFSTIKPIKYQRQMDCLRVYCSMKGRGCDWSGMLGQLDTHLDPDQNDCQHVDIKCPLNCQQTTSKNKVEQHLAMECIKRDYVCQYCNFNATYEVMVKTHWPVCIFFPIQCPNFCGVTCERDVVKDHMKMCCLEEVVCEFSGMGCDKRFRREYQEEHTRQNILKHLSMTAAASVKINQKLQHKLQQKLLEEETKLQEQEEKLQEQEEKLQEQEEKLQEQEEKLQEQEEKLQEQEEKLQEQEEKLQEQELKYKNKFEKQKKKLQELEGKLQEQELKFKNKFEKQEEKLQEQEKKLQEQEEKLQEQEEKLQEQEEKLQEQEEKLQEQEGKLQEQEEKLQEQEEKLQEQEEKLQEQEEKLQEQEEKLQEQEEKLQEQELILNIIFEE